MARIIRLTESDLTKLVERVIKQQADEAFLIPKGMRKRVWEDEEIASKVLNTLKSMKDDPDAINKFNIRRDKSRLTSNIYFEIEGYDFDISQGTAGINWMEMNGHVIDASSEIVKQIREIIRYIEGNQKRIEKSNFKSDFLKRK